METPILSVQTLPVISKDNFRYDGIMSKNAIAFKHQFQDDGYLINDILYYIAFKYQSNPFEYRQLSFFQKVEETKELDGFSHFKFSVKEFCDILGYQKNNLREIHPRPKYLIDSFGNKFLKEIDAVDEMTAGELVQFLGNREEDKDLSLNNLRKKARSRVISKYKDETDTKVHWDTIIANAVYRAATEKFKFRFETEDKELYSGMAGGIELLKVAIKHDYKDNMKETFYTFYINRDFEKNLNKYFVTTNIKYLKKLKKPKLLYLYDYILYLRKVAKGKKTNRIESDIKLLAEVAEINDSNIRKLKYRINEKFNAMVAVSKIDASLQWKSNGPDSRFLYKPVIVFNDLTDEKGIMSKAFLDKLEHDLIEFYRENFKGKNWSNYHELNSFKKWLYNGSYNLKDKYSIYTQVNKEILSIEEPDFNQMQDYFKQQ